MLTRNITRVSIATVAVFLAGLAAAPAVTAQSATAGSAATEYVVVTPDQTGPATTYWSGSWGSEPQGPQEVRIMNRIIRTALDDVEPPEMPDALKPEEAGEGEEARPLPSYVAVSGELAFTRAFDTGARILSIGEKGVTGFYMKGYGYLFNIRWHVGGSGWNVLHYGDRGNLVVALEEQNAAMQRVLADRIARRTRTEQETETEESRLKQAQAAAEEALQEEKEKVAAREEAMKGWRMEYSEVLVEALMDVIATYGSTLHQVQPDEAITFIADFGEEEEDTVTLTILGRELRGPGAQGADRVRAAIKVNRGGTETSEGLKTQMKIMSEIIDAAFEAEADQASARQGTFGLARSYNLWSVGRGADAQHIPGYGVIFRKSARQHFSAYTVVGEVKADEPEPTADAVLLGLQARLEESEEEHAQHLESLKRKTAEIFSTYGSSMTELSANEWLGIHYDVGGAAQLLQGGPDYFLVQAKMSDVRSAAGRQDGSDWLLGQLITNEKQE